MLRVQLGCERRCNIEFYGAHSHYGHSAYFTWRSGSQITTFTLVGSRASTPLTFRGDVIYVSSALQILLPAVSRNGGNAY